MSKTADKMFKKLGYEKQIFCNAIRYAQGTTYISFFEDDKAVLVSDGLDKLEIIGMEELKAIYKWCEEQGWI